MVLRGRRQLLVWTAIPLLVGQVGCAGRGLRVSLPEQAAAVREAEQKRCREFGRRVEADRYRNVKERSVLVPALLTVVSIPLTVAGLATIPFGGTPPLGMIEAARKWTQENVQHNRVIREGRKATYEQAMTDCLQPTILEETLGPDHPDVARSLRTLANGHVSLREYADAEALFKRSLLIRENALGPEHPAVAESLTGLARLYFLQSRYAEAEPLLQRSLMIREKAYGPNHPHVVDSLMT